MALTDYLIFVI